MFNYSFNVWRKWNSSWTFKRRRFDLLWFLRILGLANVRVPGEQVSSDSFHFLYRTCIQLFLLFIVIRHTYAIVYANDLVRSFYASNLTFVNGPNFSRLHMTGFVLFSSFSIFTLRITNHLNRCSKCVRWLMMLVQSPAEKFEKYRTTVQPTNLIVPRLNTLHHLELQAKFDKIGYWFVRVLLVQSLVAVLITFAYFGYFFYPFRYQLRFFWTTMAINTVIGGLFFFHCNFIIITIQFCLSFLCYWLRNDIRYFTSKFNLHGPSQTSSTNYSSFQNKNRQNLKNIDRFKQVTFIIIQANQFWQRVISVNYMFFSMIITVIQTLFWFTDNWLARATFILINTFFYLFGFVIPIWQCGEVHHGVIKIDVLDFLF